MLDGIGTARGQSRAGGQPCAVADARPVAGRGSRPACCWTCLQSRAESTWKRPWRRGRGASCWRTTSGPICCPAHWLFRENYPVRFYMERPRHISRYMSRHFQTDGPLGQDKLFISRQGVPADSASSILRAARAIKAGLLLYLAGDVRWTGKLTETAQFLGRTDAILDDVGRAGGPDRSAGGDGLLPDGARRTIPHRVSPGFSCAQGRSRAEAKPRCGSGSSWRCWKTRFASTRPTATTISSGAIWTTQVA